VPRPPNLQIVANDPDIADAPEEEPAEGGKKGKLPAGRVARTARFGKLVGGQGLRWAGTRAANLTRDDEESERRMEERALKLADELVDQLGKMRGAAMKIGQVLSTIDFEAIPEGERENFKAKLAALRDSAPSVPFPKIRKVIEQDLGGKVSDLFAEFDEDAFAAASIGQVHRAVTHDGDEIVVKVQYPGVAEAVETDLRNMNVLLPLLKRLAPGLDGKALASELRERIGEELDYELEAQNQRRVERSFRDHPFIKVPKVYTELSGRRVLVSEFVEGDGFETIKKMSEEDRDRFGEIVFRFFFALLHRERFCSGDPHPGNYLRCPDGSVCFLDFGLMKHVSEETLKAEHELAAAVMGSDPEGVKASLDSLGYLPEPDRFDGQMLLDQMMIAGQWAFEPGFRRITPDYVMELAEVGSSPRSPYFAQMRQMTLPPEALLVRRMEALVFSVMGELRAGGDWHALGNEFWAKAEPSTELGRIDAQWRSAARR
jgi:predicted unusual protein kinase regulating ubiquinone biosynthesis (AarF/ABC1/UbiB family)